MPNPNDYDSQSSFMSACVTKLKDEGKSASKAKEICNGMWYSSQEIKELKENIIQSIQKIKENG